jgi:hypothetical protein
MIQFVMNTGRFQLRALVVEELIEDGGEREEVDVGLEMEGSSDDDDDDVGGSH